MRGCFFMNYSAVVVCVMLMSLTFVDLSCKWSEVLSVTTLPVPPGSCKPPRLHGRPKSTSLAIVWGQWCAALLMLLLCQSATDVEFEILVNDIALMLSLCRRSTIKLSCWCICILLDYGLPYRIGQTIIFSCCGFFFLFFPRLISAVAGWMSTIHPHIVWP